MRSIAALVFVTVIASAFAAEHSNTVEQPSAVMVVKDGRLGYATWGDPTPAANLSDEILLIGAKPMPAPAPIIIKPTSMFPLDEVKSAMPRRVAVSGAPVFIEPPVPKGALRPDGNGQILLPNRRPLDIAAASDGLKNPWGIRIAPASSITDYDLHVNGVVQGPKPVVLINGQGLIRGERIGSFTLAEIRRSEVVMEYDGTFFVLPEGKKITVRIPRE